MIKLFMLTLAAFILSGCHTPAPAVPYTLQKCTFPRLPTYATPPSRKIKVIAIDANRSIIANADLIELVFNNTKMRNICSDYAVIIQKTNREYQK